MLLWEADGKVFKHTLNKTKTQAIVLGISSATLKSFYVSTHCQM